MLMNGIVSVQECNLEIFLLRSYDFANIAVTLTISLELFPRVLSFFSFGFFSNLKPEVVIKLAIGRYLDFII